MVNTYCIGIDGGGTRTTARVGLTGKPVLHVLSGGPLNICSVDKDKVKATLQRLVIDSSRKMGGELQCAGICIGAAGFSNPETVPFLTACVAETNICHDILVVSDAHIALYGALESDVGAILISGTGSVCYGRNKDDLEWQTGGGGHLIDDAGSGYAIGRDILSTALQVLDGRLEGSVLTRILADQKNLESRNDLISFTYQAETAKASIASLAPLLGQACAERDSYAMMISERAASSLCLLAKVVIDKLGLEHGAIALAGSILAYEPFVSGLVERKLKTMYPRICIHRAKNDAAEGARLLAERI